MTDNSFLAAQIRAARAILGWSQSYLAEGCNVSKSTIVDLEANRRIPHETTLMVVLDQLTAAGINFTADGIEVRQWPLRVYVPVGISNDPAAAKLLTKTIRKPPQRKLQREG